MATTFRNVLQSGIGTTPTTVLTTTVGVKTTVVGLSITNTTPNAVLTSILLQDTVASTSAYYVSNVPVPPNQSLRVINGGERLVLGPSTNIIVTSSASSSLDMVLSFVEVT